jgi:hypothetical protein
VRRRIVGNRNRSAKQKRLLSCWNVSEPKTPAECLATHSGTQINNVADCRSRLTIFHLKFTLYRA